MVNREIKFRALDKAEKEMIVQGWHIYRFLADDLKLPKQKLVRYLKAFNLNTQKGIDIADEEELLYEEDKEVLYAAQGILPIKNKEVVINTQLVHFYDLKGYEKIADEYSFETKQYYEVFIKKNEQKKP